MTLTELAVVMGVLLVLAALGYASMRDQLPRFRTVRAAKELRSDLAELRDLAVQTNRETRLLLVSSAGDCTDGVTWGGSWSKQIGNSSLGSTRWDVLPDDALEDGIDDAQAEGTVDIGEGGSRATADACLRRWATIDGPGGGDNRDAIVFSPRGWARNPAGDFGSSGYIALTFVNADAVRRGASDEVTVLVTRAGMVRLASNRGDDLGPEVGTAVSSTATD